MQQAPMLTITDAMLARYRSRFDLSARAWQDETVRSYVLALSSCITIALSAGHERTAHDIAAMLASLEPLEAIREHDYGGYVLWIAFNWHCVRDRETTRAAIEAALKQWTRDNRLMRMRAVTTNAARPPQPIVMPTANATTPHVSFGDTGMTPVVPPSE